MIEVFLSAATICFGGMCYPALVGTQTPVGQFTVIHRPTRLPGYGGDVLVFHEDARYVYAVHRTWSGREQLYGTPRRNITRGCINVQPEVYQRLVTCCNGARLVIR